MGMTNEDIVIDSFIPLSVLVSIASIVIYFFRYGKFNKFENNQYPKDLTKLVVSLFSLNIWNIVFIITNNHLSNFFIRGDAGVKSVLIKDICTAFMIVISIFLVYRFCDGILGCIQLISLHSMDNDAEHSVQYTRMEEKRHKSVSFRDELETLTYLEMGFNILHSKLSLVYSLSNFFNAGVLFRSIILFVTTTIVSALALPETLLFNSTTLIFSMTSPVDLTIKSEHVFIATMLLFGKHSIGKILHLINQPQTQHFPKSTLLLATFIWAYLCVTLCSVFLMIMISEDIVYNICKLILSQLSTDSYLNKEKSINLFTRSFLIYINHIISPTSEVTNEFKWDVLRWVSLLFENCVAVLSTSYFIILPLSVWVLLVEFKLGGFKIKSHL